MGYGVGGITAGATRTFARIRTDPSLCKGRSAQSTLYLHERAFEKSLTTGQ